MSRPLLLRALRAIRVLVPCTVIAIACAPGDRPPAAPVRGTLGVGGEQAPKGDNAPFAVVFAAPSGEATSAAELSLVFNRPIRSLELAENASIPPITITPPIAGAWLWVGTKALRFVPASMGEQKLPGAHAYAVEVPATVRALDGSTLGKPYRLEFKTPRPVVVNHTPGDNEEGLPLDTTYTLEWNQPVDPAAFQKAASFVLSTAGGEKKIPFVARRPEAKDPKRMVVAPKEKLPKNSTFILRIAENLVGQEGPLPTGKRLEFGFKTYGALGVERFDCDTNTPHGDCSPRSTLGLVFTNAVKRRDLKNAVTIEPPIKFTLGGDGGDEDDKTRYAGIHAAFAPGQTYTLTVAKELADEYGQALGTAYTRTVKFDDYFPYAEIGVSGDTLAASAARPIDVGSINVPAYEVATLAVDPKDVGAFLDDSGETDFDKLSTRRGVKRRKVKPSAPKNTLAKESISMVEALPKGRGVLAMAIRFSRDEKDYRRGKTSSLLKVTNLGVSAKVSKHGSIVWVTQLDTGAPVQGATVRIFHNGEAQGPSYTTDADGFAKLPAGAYQVDFEKDATSLLVVSKDDDWTYEPFSGRFPEWSMSVPVDLRGTQAPYGLLFTERGVYRPGDTVKVKGIVRQETPTGNGIPAGQEMIVTLKSSEGEEIAKMPVVLSRYGTFTVDAKVPSTASLGQWYLWATPKDGAGMIQGDFQVAEYRPAEFKATAETSAHSYVRGATAGFTIRGDYLFGAPMAGGKATYFVTRGGIGVEIPGASDFAVDPMIYYGDLPNAALEAGPIANADVVLDASGTAAFTAKLALPGQRMPELVRLDAEVTDVSRQTVSASASAIVHPADFYVGLKSPDDYFVPAPGAFATQVIAVTPEGKRLEGKKVHVDLVHRRWTTARETTKSGETQIVSKVVDRIASSCDVVTAPAPVSCSLTADKTGYYVVIARTKDGHGNAVESSFGLYGTGSGGGASFADSNEATVELVPNKKQYKVGETAKVMVKSPFAEADALVTVERAGVYRSEKVKLKGAASTVSVAITDDLRPNAFVSVHLLRSAKSKGVGPLYRVGYAELSIDAEARRLKIDVDTNKKDYRPGEEVTVALTAKDTKGAPAQTEMTVYAVDEGVLMLTGYKTPDPLPVFTAPRPLQVATLETRRSMATLGLGDLLAALGEDKGDEGGGGGETARGDFKTTAYFNPSVVTDASGRASVKFKLPDNLTTFRVMAVAASDTDRYGFGAASVTTSKKLMARPNLPRFLRAGDRAEAGIVVSSKGLPKSQVTVRASISGLAIDGPLERVVEVPEKGSVEVRFPFHADAGGTAKFRFDVSAGGERDAVEVTRSVQVPGKLEAVALYGSTTDAAAEKLGDMTSIRRDVGSLDVSVSPSALVGLDGSMLSLIEYPYLCTEQLSSRLLPLVPLRDLAQRFGFSLPTNANAMIGDTVRDILTRQQSNGGFGMWPESSRPEPWVSAYATWALHEAAARGERVPKVAFDRAHQYLRTALASFKSDPIDDATATMFVDVLASAGAPDPGYMARLYEQRKKLPLFARALLLHALAVGKGPADAVKTLAGEISSELRIDKDLAFPAENLGSEYRVLFDSSPRTTALVLRALMAASPDHALAAPLARGLLSMRRGVTWMSTQETAYALVALDEYRKVHEKTPARFKAKLWFGETSLLQMAFDGTLKAEKTSLPLAKLPDSTAQALVFQKEGSGTMYYQARLRYAKKALPTTPLDAGFYVQKALRDVQPANLQKAIETVATTGDLQFKAGDLVLADLVVVAASPRDYVVIEDPLPAGFEAVDTGLSTTAAWLDVPGSSVNDDEDCYRCEDGNDYSRSRGGFTWSWYRQEVRDDRVLFFVDHMSAGMYHYRYLARATTSGTFVVPPTQAEEMYSPETFGRTGAASIVVQ